jgi:isoquinoline 1-oxidoreductase beta subunit
MDLDQLSNEAGDGAGFLPESGVARRTFLKASAAASGGLLLSFCLPVTIGGAEAADATPGNAFAPNAFIRIGRDDSVTFIIPQVEMGQGTYTALPMLIAEELEVDLAHIRLQHAPPEDKLYANPLNVHVEAAPPDDKLYVNPLIGFGAPGFQATGGSTSVQAFWNPLRRAGAAARAMLVSAAAEIWNVDANSCRAENGVVIHTPTGRKLTYGALVDKAATLPGPEKVALKDPKDFKLIGTSVKRLDTSDKADGKAAFGIDVKIPGMKIATVATCPVFGGKLASVDDSGAKRISPSRRRHRPRYSVFSAWMN